MTHDTDFTHAVKRAMVMSSMLIEISTGVGGHGYEPVRPGFETDLRRAMVHLAEASDGGAIALGVAEIDHLWEEVPHIHVRLS